MPRSFTVSVESSQNVEQILGAFGDSDYWPARFDALGTSTTLDSLLVDGDGVVTVVTTQDLRHDALPRLVEAFYRRDLKIHSTETWTPIGSRQVRGEVTIAVAGAPGSGYGTGLLTPAAAGSRLDFHGTVVFRVPLVGGKIESYIGGLLAEQIAEIQRFTTAWLIDGGR
jgi:Protein of unknown function (DUF2505)